MKMNNRNEHGIIFQGWGVVAVQNGTKTKTRRIIKPQPIFWSENCFHTWKGFDPIESHDDLESLLIENCRYGKVGDGLWIKETWNSDEPNLEYARAKHEDAMSDSPIFYRADKENDNSGCQWRSAMFMPRWASRIDLTILTLQAELIQDITDAEIIAEGVQGNSPPERRVRFCNLWNEINLTPKPIYRKINGKRKVVCYESYPFDTDDFNYPDRKTYRGKPLKVFPNPYVFVLGFEEKK